VAAIRLPTDPLDEEFIIPETGGGLYPDGTLSSDEGFYILATGCATTAIVARIKVTIVG
jgi:hypothetical protein